MKDAVGEIKTPIRKILGGCCASAKPSDRMRIATTKRTARVVFISARFGPLHHGTDLQGIHSTSKIAILVDRSAGNRCDAQRPHLRFIHLSSVEKELDGKRNANQIPLSSSGKMWN